MIRPDNHRTTEAFNCKKLVSTFTQQVHLRLNRCCTLCVCHTTPTQKLFRLRVFRQAGPPQRIDCLVPRRENSIKCLTQGHSDALPHRESNYGFTAFPITSPALYRATPSPNNYPLST